MTQHTLMRLPDGSRALAYPVASFEVVDGRLANGMSELAKTVLLDGRLMQYPDGRLEARYPVADELLSERLQRPFTVTDACALFNSIADLIDQLIERQMPIMNVRMGFDEVAVNNATGRAYFAFLPLTNIVPDLKASQTFFESVGELMHGADKTAEGLIGSYRTFFQAYSAFDVMAFSKHLHQLVASAMCSFEPNETIPEEAAAPERFPRGGERTTCLDVDKGDDQGTTVLQIEEANDSLTTVLPTVGQEQEAAKQGHSEPDNGTVVLDAEDDPYADEHVIQSRQGLTGVLSDLDFSILDDVDEANNAADGATASKDGAEVHTPKPMKPAAEDTEAAAVNDAPHDEHPACEQDVEHGAAPEGDTTEEPAPESGDAPAAETTTETATEARQEPEDEADSDAAVEGADASVPEPALSGAPTSAPEPAPEPEPTPAPAPEPALEADAWSMPAYEPVPRPQPEPAPAPPAHAPRRHFIMTRLRTGETFEIRGRHFVVGKSKHSSFQVRNTTTVSRSHAIFCVKDGVCTVTDDSSRNGTFVNGERLEPGQAMVLEDGDTVRMSDVDFVFEID